MNWTVVSSPLFALLCSPGDGPWNTSPLLAGTMLIWYLSMQHRHCKRKRLPLFFLALYFSCFHGMAGGFAARWYRRAEGAHSPAISIASQGVPPADSRQPALPCGILGNSPSSGLHMHRHILSKRGRGLSHGRGSFPHLFLLWAPSSLSPKGVGCTLDWLCLHYEEFSFSLLEVNSLLLVNNFMLKFPK